MQKVNGAMNSSVWTPVVIWENAFQSDQVGGKAKAACIAQSSSIAFRYWKEKFRNNGAAVISWRKCILAGGQRSEKGRSSL